MLTLETMVTSVFLSTPSARRATPHQQRRPQGLRISIHALCEEGDALSLSSARLSMQFLSTPSARRATCWPAYSAR